MAPAKKSTSSKIAAKKPATRRSRNSKKVAGPKPTTILLVRHGRTPTTGEVLPGRAKGLHLGDEGKAQAQRAADRIAALGAGRIGAVYASPMERARETAAPIAKATGLRIRQHKGLIEADFGDWTGRKLSELNKLDEWKQVQKYPSGFRFPGGESFTEMQGRMTGALQELVTRHPGETIVCTSHADTIKAAVADAMGTHLDLFQRIVIGPCSITAITYTTGGPMVLAVNSMGDNLKDLVPS
jgi:probable phosphomutase (TIGR03848 family)